MNSDLTLKRRDGIMNESMLDEKELQDVIKLSIEVEDEIKRLLPEIENKFNLKEKGIQRIQFALLTAEKSDGRRRYSLRTIDI